MRRSSTQAGSDIASNYKSWITDKNMLAYCCKKLYTTCPWLRSRVKKQGMLQRKEAPLKQAPTLREIISRG